MLPAFAAACGLYPQDKTWEGKVRHRQRGGGAKGGFPQMEASCSLSSSTKRPIRCKPCTACPFALSQPQTPYWIHRLLPAATRLNRARGRAGARREPVATSPLALEGAPDGVIDGAERRRQRPNRRRLAKRTVQRQEENAYG